MYYYLLNKKENLFITYNGCFLLKEVWVYDKTCIFLPAVLYSLLFIIYYAMLKKLYKSK